LILLWHGGFWRQEWDRTHLGPMAEALSAQGYAVALPEYRRTGGDGGWPATFEDVAAAADFLPGEIARLVPGRIDHERVVYAGHSAGGHLAVWASRRHLLPPGSPGRLRDAPSIVGVVALAPVLDLGEAFRLDLDGGAVAALLGGSPEEYPERYDATNPMRIGGAEPRVTIVHGDRDQHVPIALSRMYRDAIGAELIELPGAEHFAVIDPESTAWQSSLIALREMSRSPPVVLASNALQHCQVSALVNNSPHDDDIVADRVEDHVVSHWK
jgi:acetyl esterase/lipase